MIRVRRAVQDDVQGIMNLLDQVLYVHHLIRPDLFRETGSKYTVEELKAIIDNDKTPVFVAIDENQVLVGHSFVIMEDHFGPCHTGYKTAYIDDLCVDTECRGEHVGKQLFEYVKEYSKEQGCHNITLHVWEGNDNARGFYEAMGMKAYMTGMEVVIDELR